jgi:segregation and condensation protein A
MNVALASLRRPKYVLDRTPPPESNDGSSMIFRVELDLFRGPLDLLLYLVRKHEVDVVDLPISDVTDQFLAYLELLQQLDIDRIGEFIEMAGVLLEIKSRLVLPHADEVEEPLEDPRKDLVAQLLEYKKYRDAASMLEDRFRTWQDRFGRLSTERPTADEELANEPIHEVELWDLVSAFQRIVREKQGMPQNTIKVEEVPIHVHMERIAAMLNSTGHVALGDLFEPEMPKTRLVGLFLAVLELVRHHEVRTEQNDEFGEIHVYPGPQGKVTVDASLVENYDPHGAPSKATAKPTVKADDAAATATVEADEATASEAANAPRIDAAAADVPAPHDQAEKAKSRTRKPR